MQDLIWQLYCLLFTDKETGLFNFLYARSSLICFFQDRASDAHFCFYCYLAVRWSHVVILQIKGEWTHSSRISLTERTSYR